MHLLGQQHRDSIESHLHQALHTHLCAPGLEGFCETIKQYLRTGGKRVRPQLAAWTFLRCAGALESLPQPLLEIASGWELFHAFLLIHDDIIDQADHRRGEPALHHTLAQLDSNSLTFGTHLGIVAGDLLYSVAMQLWHDLDVPAETHRALLKLFSRTASTTGFGQAIDICTSHRRLGDIDEGLLLNEYVQKTAVYTFEGPMLSGAILAGASMETRQSISRFGLALGQAYQLQNDLIDLRAELHGGSDLMQGKRTLTLLRHRAQLPMAEQFELDAQVDAIMASSGSHAALQLAHQLRSDMLTSGAADATGSKIELLLREADTAAQDPALPPALRTGCTQLLDTLRQAYFA